MIELKFEATLISYLKVKVSHLGLVVSYRTLHNNKR